MTLGEKLRRARQERGLTQSQVAGSKITRNMLSQIENDQAKPSVRTLEYLAAVLGVDIGRLLSEDDDSTLDRMRSARACYRMGDLNGCLEHLKQVDADDEAHLLIALCASELAQRARNDERWDEAEELARKAEDALQQGLYPMPQVLMKTMRILLACAERKSTASDDDAERLQRIHQRFDSGAEYHLAMARHHLLNEHVQAAEREIWSIGDLPDEHKAEYLILRGRIAVSKAQYENAALYLRQAEEIANLPRILRRELCGAMEVCCRETEDFKNAYMYAAKQLEL